MNIPNVDELVSQPLPETQETTVLKPQLLVNAHFYLTQKDWDQLGDINKFWLAEANFVVARLKHLGLRSRMSKPASFA